MKTIVIEKSSTGPVVNLASPQACLASGSGHMKSHKRQSTLTHASCCLVRGAQEVVLPACHRAAPVLGDYKAESASAVEMHPRFPGFLQGWPPVEAP